MKRKCNRMEVGDLVEPKFKPWSGRAGIVMDIGFMGAVSVRFMSGDIKTFNLGCLNILSNGTV